MRTSTTGPTPSKGSGSNKAGRLGQAQARAEQPAADTVPKLPIPTSDALMADIAAGAAAVAASGAKFLSWNVTDAVPQIATNSLDPALVELMAGPKKATALVRGLRKHYSHIREQFPEQFRDVAAVWREQRAWWVKYVEPGGRKALTAWNEDVLKGHPSGPLYLKGHAPRQRRSADVRRREGAARTCLTSHAVRPATFAELKAAANASGQTISVTAGDAFRSGLGRFLRSKAGRTPRGRSVRGKRISLYVPDKVAENANRACETTGRKMSALIAEVLETEFEHRRKPQEGGRRRGQGGPRES